MKRTFWIGVYPGLTAEMLDYATSSIIEFVNSRA
jgi:CDP-6-deoxy-D-xylo-4-hexulose-3-dehydrase